MPLLYPAKHSGLIVATLWQNNLGHPTPMEFERDACSAISAVGNLALSDNFGSILPSVIIQSDEANRRLGSWVARVEQLESANSLAKRIKQRWIGEYQPGVIRQFELGNGHQPRGNYANVFQVQPAAIYIEAFQELKLRASGNGRDVASLKVKAIVDHLWRLLTRIEGE
jgi:hypothetical protein